MYPSQKLLVIGSPSGIIPDDIWSDFESHFEVRMYDFLTLESFHDSLREGDCRDIVGILRLGLNIPADSAKVMPGWTYRGLPHFPDSLRVVVNFGHAFNDEAVDTLEARGVKFFNTTGGSESTAVVGTYLIIAAFRGLSKYECMLRNDEFLPGLRHSAKTAVDPFGKKLGIIGMGSIGQAVARHAAALGMQVHCIDRSSIRRRLEQSESSEGSSHGLLPPIKLHQDLPNLVQSVDCVLLSCPLSAATHHLLRKKIFDVMKRGMRVVNISRGQCIDEEALCDAIESGVVAGVGLDVHHDE